MIYFLSFLFACDSLDESPKPTRSNQVSPLGIRGEVQDSVEVPEILVSSIQYNYEQLPKNVYAAGNNINLRATASIKAAVQTKIPLGHPITVLQKDKSITIGDRKNYWYKVETLIKGKKHQGYLFGPTMTPSRIVADLDGDGSNEIALGTYNERHEFLLRVADPNGSSPVLWTNIGRFAHQGKPADSAQLKFYSSEITGVPLLKLEVDCIEKCNGAAWTKFIAYTQGTLVRALEYNEYEKPKAYSIVELYFSAGKKTVSTRRIHGKVDAENKVKETTQKSMYAFTNGKYRLGKGVGLGDVLGGPAVAVKSQAAAVTPTPKPVAPPKPVTTQKKLQPAANKPAVQKSTAKPIPKPVEKKSQDFDPRIEPSEG